MGSGGADGVHPDRWYGADVLGGDRMNGLSLLGYVVMTVMVCAWYVGAKKGLWR